MAGDGSGDLVLAGELRTPRAAGVAGLAFSALFVTSLLLLRNHPGSGSSAAEIEAWYLRDAARHVAIVGVYLAPFAGIAFLWFIAVIRDRFGKREDRFFATAFFGSGLLFVAMLFAAAAAASAPLAAVRFQGAPVPDPQTVTFARALAFTLLYVYGVKSAAVFMLVASTVSLRMGALPHWLVIVGYVVALGLLLSVTFFEFLVLLFPLWVTLVSVVILRDGLRASPEPAT